MFIKTKKLQAFENPMHLAAAAFAAGLVWAGFVPRTLSRRFFDGLRRGFFALTTPVIAAPLLAVDGVIRFALKIVERPPAHRQPSTRDRAFSLIELIVVITIIGIISASSIFGFGKLADILQVKQVTNVMDDTVKNAQLEVLRQDYSKESIHFLQKYLVVVASPESGASQLGWDMAVGCAVSGELTYGAAGTLTKKDQDGKVLDVQTVAADGNSGCLDFTDAAEQQWRYTLTSGDTVLGEVRFVHFNVNRESTGSVIKITKSDIGGTATDPYTDDAIRLDVIAPYANRRVYAGNEPTDKTVTLYLKNDNTDPESFILQK